MRFDMMQLHTLCIKECFQSSYLVPYHGGELIRVELDVPTAEALDVWEAGVGADKDVMS